MDPVTHGLTGALLSNLFPRKRAVLTVLLVASLAPDLDYITRLWGADVFMRYHRGITHGVAALLLFTLLMGLSIDRGKGFLFYASLSFLGYGTHLVMDLVNQYPVRILSPLDWSRYSLDLVFIIDPYISGAVLLGVVLAVRKGTRRFTVTAAVLLFLIGYLGCRSYLKGLAEDFLRGRLDEYHYRLSPLPNDFLRWWFITRSGAEYKVGFVDLFTRRVYIQERFVYSEEAPEVKESKQLKTVRSFLYFARFPLPEVERKDGETIVTWRELSYAFLPGEHFTARIRFDRMGRAVEEAIRF